MAKFGAGSMYEAMMQHIGAMSRRIALVERYGPDPATQMRLQYDLTAAADHSQVENLAGALSARPQTYWKLVSGETSTPVNLRIANVWGPLRSLQIAGKLGWALWSSMNDVGNVVIAAGYNRIPYWQLMKNIAAQGTNEGREFMTTHGMIADSVASRLDQWSSDHLASNWSGHLANSTLKLSLLTAWTDGLRQGFKLSLATTLARMAKKPWVELTEFDRIRLSRSGVTAEDWAALMQVRPATFRGAEVLTPEAIHDSGVEVAPQLAARVFSFVEHECETGVLESDLAARSITTGGGLQAGTYSGEIIRTLMQFKSFPIAMITRHWKRFLEGDHNAEGAPLMANRYLYGIAMLGSSLALGAIGEQLYQLLHGKDPIDMSRPGFWLKAMMRGGGLSIAGDMLLMNTTAERSTKEALGRMVLGPSFGTAADFWELTKGNIDEYLAGKDTHVGAEAVRFGKSLMPVANVWWVQPLVEHGLLNAINENLSPGYLDRMKARAAKEWNQHYWWAPDASFPERAPDLGEAFHQ